jgi:hypothetical protein
MMDFTTLDCIRTTTTLLLQNPTSLQHFSVDLSKLDSVVDLIQTLVVRDYSSPKDIPPHSRWRHFTPNNNDRITTLLNSWKDVTLNERVKRLLDLFIVSVLLDAGAGADWKFIPKNETVSYNRSEGLALASLDWFLAGGFSSDKSNQPLRVDSTTLKALTTQDLLNAFQVSDTNPLIGQERLQLLVRLGSVCDQHPEIFGSNPARPGNILDYLLNHQETVSKDASYLVDISTLWYVVMHAFSGVWPPTRTIRNGKSLGDVWPCKAMEKLASLNVQTDVSQYGLVAFHKLSQWLTYSLMEPLALAGIQFTNVDKLTGLAEYRNGGLFVDMGVLQLKSKPDAIPKYHVYDDVVVEWRALTVALLDVIGQKVRERLSLNSQELPLAKVLEAGTWKAGREIAAKLRPLTKGPPIEIISDGTVF